MILWVSTVGHSTWFGSIGLMGGQLTGSTGCSVVVGVGVVVRGVVGRVVVTGLVVVVGVVVVSRGAPFGSVVVVVPVSVGVCTTGVRVAEGPERIEGLYSTGSMGAFGSIVLVVVVPFGSVVVVLVVGVPVVEN